LRDAGRRLLTPGRRAIAVSVVVLAVVLSPLVRDPRHDGYPLSTYPMFATPRDTRMSISFAVGETADGAHRTLTPMMIGTPEVLQAAATIARAVGRGGGETAALCERIAAAVAGDGDFEDVAGIAIVTGEEDAIAYFTDGTRGPERVRARCRVVR
jgi:hypothetical protein